MTDDRRRMFVLVTGRHPTASVCFLNIHYSKYEAQKNALNLDIWNPLRKPLPVVAIKYVSSLFIFKIKPVFHVCF